MLLKEAALHSVGHLTTICKGWNADCVTVLFREAPLHRLGLLTPQWSVWPTWRSRNKEKMAARSRREQEEVEITDVKDELNRDDRMREPWWRCGDSSQCWTLNILKSKIRNGLISKISENLKLRSQIYYNAHKHTHTRTAVGSVWTAESVMMSLGTSPKRMMSSGRFYTKNQQKQRWLVK